MSDTLLSSAHSRIELTPRLQRVLGYGIPIVLGGIISIASALHILTPGEPFFTQVIVGLVGGVLAGPLLLGGLWLARSPTHVVQTEINREDPPDRWWHKATSPNQATSLRPAARIGAWCLAGALPVGFIASLAALYQLAHGVALANPWLLVMWGGGAGGIGGFVTGVYDSRRAYELTQYERVAERLTTLVETVPIALITLDQEGEVEAWNQAAESIFGYERREVLGDSPPVIPDEEQAAFDEVLQQVESGHTISRKEAEWQRHDGSRVAVQFGATPLQDPHEHDTSTTRMTGDRGDGAEHALIAVEDISAQQEREEELELLHRAIDEAPVGVTIADATQDDNPLTYVNEGFQELTGYTEDEILGRNCRFLQGEETAAEPVAEMHDAIDAGKPVSVELRNYRKDGTEFWNRVSIAPVRDETGDIIRFIGFQQDITERKEYEQELQLYQRAIDESAHVVMITDTEGTIKYVNQAFEETTGYSKEEAVGQNPRILKSGKHSDAFYEELWETITAGDVWEATLINQRKDGRLYQIEQTIAPITDTDGEITHFVGNESKITERRLREQRLSVLNRVLRHNIRNAMNVVRGNAETLAETLDDKDQQDQAAAIRDRANQLLELTGHARKIRDLFERETEDDATCDVSALLSDLKDEFHEEYPEAELTITTPESALVQVDDRLATAIREAVDNAVTHSDQTPPEVTITVTPPERTETGEWVDIMIADNGPGIPDQEQTVVEMGEETPLTHSSGIGLWLIHWVAVSFGGEVTIRENSPRGSIVTIRVPAATF